MAALPFQTPEFETYLAQSDAAFAAILACCKLSGVTFPAFAEVCVNQVIVADARQATGYRANERSSRAARHAAISRGAVRAPRRETRPERIDRECRVLGLQGAA